ncbi:MAG: SDR family oxidoreductase [Victivallaceae bacterium]|nr:SDR family oxidoreductase [Victivallaceae bacterium]
MKLPGKSVLVTGSARRVGAVIARAFAAAGCRVVIHCFKSCTEADALAAEIGAPVVCGDLTAPGGAEAVFRAAGHIDILVNNASLYRHFEVVSGHDRDKSYFETNAAAPLRLLELWSLQPLSEGAAVNIIDRDALSSQTGGDYLASKRRFLAGSNEFARKLAARNLRVSAVLPGPMIPPDEVADKSMRKTRPGLPLGRPVSPDDLAAAVLFLAANDSITGAELILGGSTTA